MEGHILFLADAFTESVNRINAADRLSSRDLLLAATLGLLMAIGLFIWTYLRFKNRRRERGELIEGAVPPKRDRTVEKSNSKSGSDSESGQVRRRKHRRRREHRPSNPTLQQTGGLPPPRPDDQLPKY